MFLHMNQTYFTGNVRESEEDRYHSLENRIDCKELQALRPLETVRLLRVRNIKDKERERRYKHYRSAPVKNADVITEAEDTVSSRVQRSYSQS